jgi:hypothetical protein
LNKGYQTHLKDKESQEQVMWMGEYRAAKESSWNGELAETGLYKKRVL